MAQPAYPDVVALEAFKNGEELAIYHQLELVAEHYSPRTREFAFDAATAVALTFCEHEDHPLALPSGLSSKERKAAASAHPGLCGVSLAAVIAGVAFGDVAATAERRGVPATYRAFRNQVCLCLFSWPFCCTLRCCHVLARRLQCTMLEPCARNERCRWR